MGCIYIYYGIYLHILKDTLHILWDIFPYHMGYTCIYILHNLWDIFAYLIGYICIIYAIYLLNQWDIHVYAYSMGYIVTSTSSMAACSVIKTGNLPVPKGATQNITGAT